MEGARVGSRWRKGQQGASRRPKKEVGTPVSERIAPVSGQQENSMRSICCTVLGIATGLVDDAAFISASKQRGWQSQEDQD